MKEKTIGRRDLLKMGGAAAAGLVLSSCKSILPESLDSLKANKDGYNILFVFADQMHGFAMGCMGNPDIKTPNLDRLAAAGTLFRNTYSCYPVCTPYRGILMTGRYARQTGVVENEMAVPANERTLAAALNDGGYRTGYVGKWHLGGKVNIAVPPELRAGFTDFIGYQCYNDFLDQVWFFDESGKKIDCKKHRTEATTDIAIERLEKIKDKKFAMFVSYQNPHYPEQPLKEFEDMYADIKITRRPNCQDVDPYTRTFSPPRTAENDPMFKKYNKSLDTYLKLYYAMITQLDCNICRLYNKLQELGIAEKTVFIFTSDHGDMQGSHGLKNKNIFYEESVRVPLIVKVPGGPKGIVSDELVSSVDLFPSIVDYAGLPKEKTAEGLSFAPITAGRKPRLRSGAETVFSEGGDIPKSEGGSTKKKWFMIRDGKYKLAVTQDDFKPTHLFDLENDPYEMKNLLEEKDKYLKIAENLQNKIKYWHKDIMKRANPKVLVKENDGKIKL